MPDESDNTVIRVATDASGNPTLSIAGVLDAAAVAAACAAVADATPRHRQFVLDVRAVTAIESDCLRQLASGLRELGVELEPVSASLVADDE